MCSNCPNYKISLIFFNQENETNNGNNTNVEEQNIVQSQMEENCNSETETTFESQMEANRNSSTENIFESQMEQDKYMSNVEGMEIVNPTETDYTYQQQMENEMVSSEKFEDEDSFSDDSINESDELIDTESEAENDSSDGSDFEDNEVFQICHDENDFNNSQRSASNSFTSDNEVCDCRELFK